MRVITVIFVLTSNTSNRDGGQVLYFDYNPNTQKYYFRL